MHKLCSRMSEGGVSLQIGKPALPWIIPNSIIYGMKLRMDKSGRVVFPKPLQKRLGLTPKIELEAVEQPDGILLRPVVQQASMIQVDGLWIHQGAAEPGANWLRVMNLVREERIQTVLKS
jgi:bifunctional DNA-binding transcriptional regulator/antitoxin component of YhaV-PrlF toxin-antitoxin module